MAERYRVMEKSELICTPLHLFFQLLTDIVWIQLNEGVVPIEEGNQTNTHLEHEERMSQLNLSAKIFGPIALLITSLQYWTGHAEHPQR